MDTTLHAPETLLPDLIDVINQGLGEKGVNPSKGEWGVPGNALKVEVGEGKGAHTFIHCDKKEDFDSIYDKLKGLGLAIKEDKRTLPEFGKNAKGVIPGDTKFYSFYLHDHKGADSSTDMLTDSDSIGLVIHNPNY
ncbi:hypothetical protein Q3A66_11975 [Hymenobacter sp. BT770]|uniref:hypothetical protein n=1 Tax=Hymenobacter sp. BT770 TaxID=2886942 RepID=UPI001D11B39B|nr:hypothetical protein [Hymenobacter sp. BT770]MCC3153550.1 hypothetical protein [Hymenobacter sp. BT770]MDO3415786.1 hypothetical protein [Hymenobacter sp. BT770]